VQVDLFDRIYGCLIGGAIGDALGAPVEGWNYWEIQAQYGKLETLIPSPRPNSNQLAGGVTDDTALRQYVALAIIEKQGRITPDDLAALWVKKGNSRLFWSNERTIYEKLSWGMNPWEAGKGANPCATASMAIAPVGVINAGDPWQAYQDGYLIASVNQDGEERDAAATMAAGVAAAFSPGAELDEVLAVMQRCTSFLMRRALDLTMEIVEASGSIAAFTEAYYRQMIDWRMPRPEYKIKPVADGYPRRAMYYSGSSYEIIPVALAILRLCEGDVNSSLIEAANFGRDCDTIATIVGCLGGALSGASAIRQDWLETCEKANRDLFEELEGDPQVNFYATAQRLRSALLHEKKRAEERVRQLDDILG
jgi:ADP-ribosylglycohydrolase